MCRELMVISALKKKDIKKIMKEYNIEGEIDSVALGCMDDELLTSITIDAIDNQCFCNINIEQKERVFDFIHAMSVI